MGKRSIFKRAWVGWLGVVETFGPSITFLAELAVVAEGAKAIAELAGIRKAEEKENEIAAAAAKKAAAEKGEGK